MTKDVESLRPEIPPTTDGHRARRPRRKELTVAPILAAWLAGLLALGPTEASFGLRAVTRGLEILFVASVAAWIVALIFRRRLRAWARPPEAPGHG